MYKEHGRFGALNYDGVVAGGGPHGRSPPHAPPRVLLPGGEPGARGGGVRLVERPNDILENFFRTLKHGERRRSGRKILTQDFEALPPAAALARNLRCPDYVRVLSGSLDALSTAFAALDREDRRAGLLVLDHAPAAHPVPETARASLLLEDRRILRTKSMNELMQRAATG